MKVGDVVVICVSDETAQKLDKYTACNGIPKTVYECANGCIGVAREKVYSGSVLVEFAYPDGVQDWWCFALRDLEIVGEA